VYAKEQEYQKAIMEWQNIVSDKDCSYDAEIELDISDLNPMISWGTNPEQSIQIDHNVPFLDEIPKEHRNTYKKDIYSSTQGIPFKKLDAEFQAIMKEEFC